MVQDNRRPGEGDGLGVWIVVLKMSEETTSE